ncbi:uncharacterized protein LOC142768855 [Rhipicephalus microplus]|uniref:uncharacterized protein LOC142768855 n=1 Tax=Rhipicephalus microplus TaxID=6941 RepID=UPI003F6D37A8
MVKLVLSLCISMPERIHGRHRKFPPPGCTATGACSDGQFRQSAIRIVLAYTVTAGVRTAKDQAAETANTADKHVVKPWFANYPEKYEANEIVHRCRANEFKGHGTPPPCYGFDDLHLWRSSDLKLASADKQALPFQTRSLLGLYLSDVGLE